MTPSTEPEETGAACKFSEQIVVAPEAAQRFIENVIERFDTVDDSTINYTDTPDLRVRRIVPGALGFINAATLSWQVRHQRLLLRSLLSQSDLAECGLGIDRVGGLVLAHESFLTVPLLESHGDQIIKALLKAHATRESRN